MSDLLKIATDIIQNGNFNKLNTLLAMNMNDEVIKTLRRIFTYLKKQNLFKPQYGNEWQQWYSKQYKYVQPENQIDQFINIKWSAFIRLLFQQQKYDDILQIIDGDVNCPIYRRLVECSLLNNFDLQYDEIYFGILKDLPINFDQFINLIKRLPEIDSKLEFSQLIQEKFYLIKESNENKITFIKLINSHIVDKVDNPLILANFLQQSFQEPDIQVKILTLSSLLVLMTNYHYNLDKFYENLIALAKYEESYNCQYKDKFLKLLDIASKSSKVPMIILANLIRAVLSTCLKQKCYLQLWAVSFVFNIFKRNPQLKKNLQDNDVQIRELGSYQNHWYLLIYDEKNHEGIQRYHEQSVISKTIYYNSIISIYKTYRIQQMNNYLKHIYDFQSPKFISTVVSYIIVGITDYINFKNMNKAYIGYKFVPLSLALSINAFIVVE